MKKNTCLMIGFLILIASQAWAAEKVTLEGTIQGYTCITTGKICPVNKNDPWIETEDVFALYTKGNDYYLVPNMNRGTLTRHVNEIVRITGEVHPKYKSVDASQLEVLKDGTWVKTWPYLMSDFRVGSGGLPFFP